MKVHILQTGTFMNPTKPRESEFFETGLVAYVVKPVHSGAMKVITSWGHLGVDTEVGKVVNLVADQTGKSLGLARVIAIVDFSTMVRHIHHEWYAHDIDRNIKHYVVK